MTVAAADDSRLRYRPPVYRTVHFAERAYRVPTGCRVVGVVDLGPGVTLAALRRRRRVGRPSTWADALVLRTFCRGHSETWYETRSSVTVPVDLAGRVAALMQQVAADDGRTGTEASR